jgi:hypothetical protein
MLLLFGNSLLFHPLLQPTEVALQTVLLNNRNEKKTAILGSLTSRRMARPNGTATNRRIDANVTCISLLRINDPTLIYLHHSVHAVVEVRSVID